MMQDFSSVETAYLARIGFLVVALRDVLVKDGVIREEAVPSPEELLLAAEEYCK